MGAGFAYQNLGILHYSRRHVIGDRRRPASAQPITSKLLRCDWLGRIRLITTQAVRHLESYSFGSRTLFSPSEPFDLQVRYLDIYLFYVYDHTQLQIITHQRTCMSKDYLICGSWIHFLSSDYHSRPTSPSFPMLTTPSETAPNTCNKVTFGSLISWAVYNQLFCILIKNATHCTRHQINLSTLTQLFF